MGVVVDNDILSTLADPAARTCKAQRSNVEDLGTSVIVWG
jgi:hypothetical protein